LPRIRSKLCCDREILHHSCEVGHQRFDRLLLALQMAKFLIAARYLLRKRRQRVGTLGASMFQRGHLAARVVRQRLELCALSIDVGNQLFQPHHLVPNDVDFTAAFPGEISIVGKRAAEAGRIGLVQQQLDLFLPADHIGRAHLLA
jgi:hypothetical protein